MTEDRDHLDPELRMARAMAEVEAFHRRRAEGGGESIRELLARAGELRELVALILGVDADVDPREDPPVTEPEAPSSGAEAEFDRFGHFRLVSRLGRGGMATVHLAFDETLARQVALKQIRPESLDSAQARARFWDDASGG